MSYATGRNVIDAIVRRLTDEDIRCYDTAIVSKLASLNNSELDQLITFGDVNKWIIERNNHEIIK